MPTPLEAKIIAATGISLASYASGLLPVWLRLGTRYERSLVLSATLCFGGGVLLATALVHILPDTREDLSKWAEVVFSSGFFLIFLMDISVDMLAETQVEEEILTPVVRNEIISQETIQDRPQTYGATESEGISSSRRHSWPLPEAAASGSLRSRCAGIGLLVAFTVHALLEGLVIGIQPNSHKVLLLLGAVACHKLVVTFCLGAELGAAGRPASGVIGLLTLYVAGSAGGILLGAAIHHFQSDPTVGAAIPILQGIAGGTLLYIVVSEVLPREKRRELGKSSGLIQLSSTVAGFAVMTVLTFNISDEPDDY